MATHLAMPSHTCTVSCINTPIHSNNAENINWFCSCFLRMYHLQINTKNISMHAIFISTLNNTTYLSQYHIEVDDNFNAKLQN